MQEKNCSTCMEIIKELAEEVKLMRLELDKIKLEFKNKPDLNKLREDFIEELSQKYPNVKF